MVCGLAGAPTHPGILCLLKYSSRERGPFPVLDQLEPEDLYLRGLS